MFSAATSVGGREASDELNIQETFTDTYAQHVTDSAALAYSYDAKIDSITRANAAVSTGAVTAMRMAIIEGNNARVTALAQEKQRALETKSQQFWTFTTNRNTAVRTKAAGITTILQYGVLINIAASIMLAFLLTTVYKESENYYETMAKENNAKLQRSMAEAQQAMAEGYVAQVREMAYAMRHNASALPTKGGAGPAPARVEEQDEPEKKKARLRILKKGT